MSNLNYSVPFVIENNGRGEKTYDIYSRLLIDRIIFVTGEVNDDMANAICAQLLFLQSQDAEKEIHMYINSPGGSVTAGLAIFDTMNYVKCPIVTYCLGSAASMGAFLLAAGEKGKRYALPNSTVMIHQPSSGTSGKVSDMERSFKESLRLKALLNKILSERTGKTIEEIEIATDRDNFMSAEEAKNFGLIDEIMK